MTTCFPNWTFLVASPFVPSSRTVMISLIGTIDEMNLPFSLFSGWGWLLLCVWGLRM
jgi:hypothetical protein